MFNIKKNKLNLLSDDLTAYTTRIMYFKHILTNNWYVFLVRISPLSDGRYAVFFINDTNSEPDETSSIELDDINKINVFFYKSVLNTIDVDLMNGEYDVYIENYEDVNVIDTAFIQYCKQNILEIRTITQDEIFSKYLKYNPTIASVG